MNSLNSADVKHETGDKNHPAVFEVSASNIDTGAELVYGYQDQLAPAVSARLHQQAAL